MRSDHERGVITWSGFLVLIVISVYRPTHNDIQLVSRFYSSISN